jgi:hypothetical protein
MQRTCPWRHPEHTPDIAGGSDSQGEALTRDSVGRLENRGEYQFSGAPLEDDEDGGLPVVEAKAEAEGGISDDASPALANEEGTEERGWIRGETED